MKDIKVILSKRERDLILKYGYPFDEIKDQLDENVNNTKNKEIVAGSFWWEQLAGDLARSLNHNEVKDYTDFEEMEELFEKVNNMLP